MSPACLRDLTGGGASLALKVQPRASRNAILGLHGTELKIAVTAPPADSAANAAVLELLAETLGCSKGSVRILRGHASRHKTIAVHGLSAAVIAEKLATFL